MKFIAILICVICTHNLSATEYVQTSRYAEIDISPNPQQVDPLQVIIDFSFPQNIETVGEAINLLIPPSGYQLNISEHDIIYLLFEMPLPEIHKHLGPVRFKDAVAILSGKGFIPDFDESLRLISFTTESESIRAKDVTPYKTAWKTRKETSPKVFRMIKVEEPKNNNYIDYVVIDGDSVSRIAKKLGLHFTDAFTASIVDANPHAFINSNPNLIMSDLTIRIPSL